MVWREVRGDSRKRFDRICITVNSDQESEIGKLFDTSKMEFIQKYAWV